MEPSSSRQRVLEALRSGTRNWDKLRVATDLNDDRLGLALAELLGRRLVWTAEQEGGRVYGLERRRGLGQPDSSPLRRATD